MRYDIFEIHPTWYLPAYIAPIIVFFMGTGLLVAALVFVALFVLIWGTTPYIDRLEAQRHYKQSLKEGDAEFDDILAGHPLPSDAELKAHILEQASLLKGEEVHDIDEASTICEQHSRRKDRQFFYKRAVIAGALILIALLL